METAGASEVFPSVIDDQWQLVMTSQDGCRLVVSGVVDDEDGVRRARLGSQGVQQLVQQCRSLIGDDDHCDRIVLGRDGFGRQEAFMSGEVMTQPGQDRLR